MRRRAAACHFKPVQFLFDDVKRIVADLVTGTQGQDGRSRGVDGATMEFAMCGVHAILCAGIRPGASEMRGEFLPDCLARL